MASIASVVLIAVSAACAPMPRVALEASPADLELLAGDWRGEYESAALGRRGSIEFKLAAGTDEAYGDVVMIPRGQLLPYAQEPHDRPVRTYATTAEVLTIKFIRAEDGRVAGMLDRYWDPDRECYATTVFRGFVGRGVIEGTFSTIFECGAGEARGNWRVTKKAARR